MTAIGTVGVVGLGAMGGRIAGRLLDQGYRVVGTNRTRSRARAVIGRGLVWCDTPRTTAEHSDVVISMVTDDAALAAVTDGPDGILAGLAPGSVYVDMSTVSPSASRALALRVGAIGAGMLSAPVSGSVPAVESGTLAIMVGGTADAFERVEPLLRELGSTVTFVGDVGHALLLKLGINVSLAVQMLAFSEGVQLAERGGVDRQLALDVLTHSAIGSPMLRARAALVLDLPEEAWFDVAMMQKDLGLALESGREEGLVMPSTTAADTMLTMARSVGYEHRDIAALFRLLSDLAPSGDLVATS
ncbi:MAG TPA: NAD(P)-dependent oxidoreductase [Nocardioides sp.]|jgi:3-hydroxyisobutyrate dehydrogenase-like beta-hydroxyacid dehydrogenase|uniref:NAD(P)-dependent oxidoreductase n=1 Tax=Nocardioides sp. TaxID=35761 RepID=UPI002E35CF36|nr:NAD(P)-dependent oxidoreductase [Nocardioides sp.]HEX3930110.1 NAD(P)-dependent oxidoreductase [Nocardioides sp.]